MNNIKYSLKRFIHNIVHNGNTLKTCKYHKMLHIIDYVTIHVYSINFVNG